MYQIRSPKSRPYWVCLKRKNEIVDPTPHVIFGEVRPYATPTYRDVKAALCGKAREGGRHSTGWRLVQRRDRKQLPDGYCEECFLLSLVEQMAQ
jgi:hypothetical protein